jgi:hypothetical protein
METTMFKKISAAVIAVSLLTAPAFAATVIKTAPAAKTVVIKPSVANAKAQAVVVKKVHRHHRKHFTHRHHARKHMAVVKKVTMKRVSAATPKTVIVKKKI